MQTKNTGDREGQYVMKTTSRITGRVDVARHVGSFGEIFETCEMMNAQWPEFHHEPWLLPKIEVNS